MPPTATLPLNTQEAERRRALRGYTQAELAQRVHASHAHVNQVLTGNRRPSAFLVHRLAAALGCDVEDLLLKDAS